MRLVVALCISVLTLGVAHADGVAERIRDRIGVLDPQVGVESVNPAPLAGLYEVVLSSGEVIYADARANYFLAGELYRASATGLVSLTDERLQKMRVSALAAVPMQDRIVYRPVGKVKARLQVFTDVDCVYCQRLHQDVPELNRMGVQVEYLAYPRGGPGSAAAQTMATIWCAPEGERQKLLTLAKSGGELPVANCANPVLDQFRLGQKLGVTGTPSLVLEDGRLIPGYMPAAQLGKLLGL